MRKERMGCSIVCVFCNLSWHFSHDCYHVMSSTRYEMAHFSVAPKRKQSVTEYLHCLPSQVQRNEMNHLRTRDQMFGGTWGCMTTVVKGAGRVRRDEQLFPALLGAPPPRDWNLMYNMVTILDNTALYKWNLLREYNLNVCNPPKDKYVRWWMH